MPLLPNKKITALLALTLITASTACFATTYTTTFSIAGNSYHEGSTRNYDAGTMKIGIKFDSLRGSGPNNMDVVLYKSNFGVMGNF